MGAPDLGVKHWSCRILLEKDADVNYLSDLHGFLLHLLAYKAVYRSIAFDL
jgi:hypothetical protein